MTASKLTRIVAVTPQDNCERCGRRSIVLFEHTTADEHGNRLTWSYCGPCDSARLREEMEERKALEVLRPELEAILAHWGTMDNHDAYEALQALSLRVVLG